MPQDIKPSVLSSVWNTDDDFLSSVTYPKPPTTHPSVEDRGTCLTWWDLLQSRAVLLRQGKARLHLQDAQLAAESIILLPPLYQTPQCSWTQTYNSPRKQNKDVSSSHSWLIQNKNLTHEHRHQWIRAVWGFKSGTWVYLQSSSYGQLNK